MFSSNRIRCATAIALALSWVPGAMAQEPGEIAEAEADAVSIQQRIIVTARKVEEDIQDVPVAISAFSGSDLAEIGVVDMRELTRFVPGLTITTASGEPSAINVNVRGQSQADILLTTDASVGIYIDGVNVPRTFAISPGLLDLQRVEVLKGPQGTLYGRNTTGGAVGLYTRAPNMQELGGFLSVNAGEYGLRDISGAVDLPIVKDTFAARFLARNIQSDGYGRDGVGRKLGSQDTSYYRVNFQWQATPDLKVELMADRTDVATDGIVSRVVSLNGFPPRPGLPAPTNVLFAIAAESGLLTFNPQDPANQGLLLAAFAQAQQIWENSISQNMGLGYHDSNATFPQGSQVESDSVALNITYDLSDAWQVKSTTGYRKLDRLNALDMDVTPFAILHPTLFTNSEFWSQEFQLAYGGDRLNSIVGLYTSHEDGTDGSTTFALAAINPNNPNRQRGDVTNESFAIYGQANYAMTDRLNLTGGLRWTEENKKLVSRNSVGPTGSIACNVPPALLDQPGVCAATIKNKFSDWSYLLSADYAVSDTIMVYAKTARGFRGGGQNLRGTAAAASFDPFDPEIATDYEIGIKAETSDGRVRVNAAAYTTDYEGIQRSVVFVDPDSAAVVSSVRNAAEATISGFEVEAWAALTDRFSVNGTLGYIDAGYDKFADATGDLSDTPFDVPEWAYSVGARYNQPMSFGQLVARLDYSWRDDVVIRPPARNDADFTQKAYGLLSARIQLDFDAWDASLAIYGKNLTDEEYLTGGVDFDSSLGWNLGFMGPPRVYGIEFVKRFGGG